MTVFVVLTATFGFTELGFVPTGLDLGFGFDLGFGVDFGAGLDLVGVDFGVDVLADDFGVEALAFPFAALDDTDDFFADVLVLPVDFLPAPAFLRVPCPIIYHYPFFLPLVFVPKYFATSIAKIGINGNTN